MPLDARDSFVVLAAVLAAVPDVLPDVALAAAAVLAVVLASAPELASAALVTVVHVAVAGWRPALLGFAS